MHIKKNRTPKGDGNVVLEYAKHILFLIIKKNRTPKGDGNFISNTDTVKYFLL